MPLKFGTETLTEVVCVRVRIKVMDRRGRPAYGWGETPLSVQWVWPSALPFQERQAALKNACLELGRRWLELDEPGHPIEFGHDFLHDLLPGWLRQFNASRRANLEPMPWLAALVCASAFDLALHDAYGNLLQLPVYSTYTSELMSRDLSAFLEPADGSSISFRGRYPVDYLSARRAEHLTAWHLVGGLDPLDQTELTGQEPQDGYPVLLADWIRQDGLKCLKVKLRGNDSAWDFERLVKVGAVGIAQGVEWLSADFNCTVRETEYVNAILDRLRDEQPRIYGMILYVEQPFAYELDQHNLDVRSVSARKPLFLDESAHDWRQVRLGRQLGWSGVALKTCKTQTGALLSACWARPHGLSLMVQDLTNPRLAQIPHVLLAAHVGTIMGVETNSMQFYPEASRPEEKVHPGIYKRRGGQVELSTLQGPGFGYRVKEIQCPLPEPAAEY